MELCDHLQVVFHVLFLNLDSPNALIHRHARIFLANLIYSLTSGQVGKLERDSPAAKFLARIEALGDRRPWAYEDPTITALDIESAKQLGQWVAEVVTLLPSFTLLPSSWGAEGTPARAMVCVRSCAWCACAVTCAEKLNVWCRHSAFVGGQDRAHSGALRVPLVPRLSRAAAAGL